MSNIKILLENCWLYKQYVVIFISIVFYKRRVAAHIVNYNFINSKEYKMCKKRLKNVKQYDIETLRNEVSMVLQKNVLFSGTIKENL